MSEPSTITTNEQAYRDGTLSQPSAPTEMPSMVLAYDAPTADIEKLITKENALAYFKQFLNGDTGMASAEVLADVMLTVQHQARAPLVEDVAYWEKRATVELNARHVLEEALERVKARVPLPSPYYEMVQAAITGTGEISRVKEGETTTK